jgi:CheY-like chemotaxis protein
MLGQTFPKTIRISAQLGDNMPDIIADASQLHQALLNLCVNSRDAIIEDMPGSPGAGTLLLRTGRIDGSSVRQKFANAAAAEYMFSGVQDNGAGMDETTKRRIFEPFFTTKERGKGTGLGLAVVYGVINSHHGFVEVESEKGKGTTFTLYFPVSSRVVAAVRKPAEPSEAGTGGSETILVVEDETLLADLLKTILQDRGYEVLVAHDGQEGFEIYQQNPDRIQLILSDMGLPRLGGYEMFLRMKEKNPKVKAILASGYFDPNLKMDLIKEGAKDFIQKPYVSEIVLRRIREVLDEKRG